MKTKVAIVIPAFNEAQTIATVVQDTARCLDDSPFDYTIVVVDDGSTDDTAPQAEAAGATVIRHILNSGSGSATATGLAFAQQQDFTVAATMDADGQHDPADVLNGLELLDGKDLLIGSRLIESKDMAGAKRIGNRGLSLVTFLLFGTYVTDSQSGLRIFSQRALNQLRWRTSGYEFCSEMLWRARQQGLKISEFPIKTIYTEYSRAKGQNNWNGFNILKNLITRRIVELFE